MAEVVESSSLTLALVLALIWFWVAVLSRALSRFSLGNANTYVLGTVTLLLVVGIVARGVFLARFPLANLYESLLFLAAGCGIAYLVLATRYGMRFLSLPTALLISLALAYALLLPESQKAAVPLLPALRSYWRWIHVPPLLVSYAFFGLAGFASIAYLVRKRDHYQEAIYRCVAMGFPLLTFGIVTGAIWANESWGNLWQWDPKENLALVTWFFYAAYLHLKLSDRASGKALAWLILVGAVATYMTYIGINQFDLGGLHTYGKV